MTTKKDAEQKIKELEELIQQLLDHVDSEARRLTTNFCSYAIGKSVKAISYELKEMVNKKK